MAVVQSVALSSPLRDKGVCFKWQHASLLCAALSLYCGGLCVACLNCLKFFAVLCCAAVPCLEFFCTASVLCRAVLCAMQVPLRSCTRQPSTSLRRCWRRSQTWRQQSTGEPRPACPHACLGVWCTGTSITLRPSPGTTASFVSAVSASGRVTQTMYAPGAIVTAPRADSRNMR